MTGSELSGHKYFHHDAHVAFQNLPAPGAVFHLHGRRKPSRRDFLAPHVAVGEGLRLGGRRRLSERGPRGQNH